MQTFNVMEKNVILKAYKPGNRGNSLEPTFKPNLNEQSLRMARDSRIQSDLYEMAVLQMREREERLNRMRAEKMLEEFEECTFHPNLYP